MNQMWSMPLNRTLRLSIRRPVVGTSLGASSVQHRSLVMILVAKGSKRVRVAVIGRMRLIWSAAQAVSLFAGLTKGGLRARNFALLQIKELSNSISFNHITDS